ncbi:MAG TPA: hypothetical protein VK171_14495, partial [Fimbriimonas sp.]|nr:hypothetical protein [Fimbriimonas sp.]
LAPVEIPPRQATDVAANPGIKIFLQRRARAGFESTDAKDLDNIAQICRLLGGLPLAIELAASASLFMPLTDLCESVATATTTLQQHDPLAKRLHQRLDLALTWSLSHVSEDAQTLVKRLANFSGSHPAALIQNLCEDLSSPYQAICQELLDRSLITQDGTLENPRFSLLGAMRVFLQPKSAGVEQVAADAYRKFALSVALDLSTDRYTIAATEAAFQVANLGNTIRRAAESRHWDEVSNLARLLYFGRHRHGELELASEELAEWLALPGLTDPNTLSTLTSLLGHVQYFQFELELASSTYQKSLVFAEQAGDETAQRVSLANVGLCALALGRFDEAFEVLTAAHGKLSLQDPERRRTTLELNIADAIYGQGKPEEAIERLQTILTRLETVTELDNFRGLACQNIARIKFAEGNAGEAEPWLQQALVSQLAINELTRIRPIRSSLAEIAIEKGDIDQAEQELKHILEDKSIRPRDLPPNIFLALAKFAKARNDNAASELFASKFRVLLDSKRTWLYPPERRKFLEQFQQAPPEFLPSDRELLALARRLIRL